MTGRLLPLTSAQLRRFRRSLLRWYDANRRDLPWRRDHDPYRVWVSEIMLQQTRVAAVLDHYARFLRRFPTVQSLAAAHEATVLALWSGLGYYHRARRMHQAAKVIARARQGDFPRSPEEWLQLPGIGRYTAAAIASIAFGERVAVVDGNVERVLQRLFEPEHRSFNIGAPEPALSLQKGLAGAQSWVTVKRVPSSGKSPTLGHPKGPQVELAKEAEPRSGGTSTKNRHRNTVWEHAQALLDLQRPGDFNQAMMELGATICTPRAPHCLLCPLHSFCQSRGAAAPLTTARRQNKALFYALARKNGSVLLVRRDADASLMAGMWELPAISREQANGDAPWLRLRHSITDTDYRVSVFSIAHDQLPHPATDARWFTLGQCSRLPLTGLARKILYRINGRAGFRPASGQNESARTRA